jgi:hypothetical protein
MATMTANRGVCQESLFVTPADPFLHLDVMYPGLQATPEELKTYGQARLVPGSGQILERPSSLPPHQILTNPTQPAQTGIFIKGRRRQITFAYFRQENRTHHLGTTVSTPYILHSDNRGRAGLVEFTDAMQVPGEDPRLTWGVEMPMYCGSRPGWLLSTIIAPPKPDDPLSPQYIQQIFYWGENLKSLEIVAEGPRGAKNTCVIPAANGTGLDVVGRPQRQPHTGNLSYFRVRSIKHLTSKAIDNAHDIDERLLTPGSGYWGGANRLQRVGPHHLVVHAHEACRGVSPEGKNVLHYRLARYGLDTQTRRICRLGAYAYRHHFPGTEPKVDEITVYDNVVYGCPNDQGRLLTGISDAAPATAQLSVF